MATEPTPTPTPVTDPGAAPLDGSVEYVDDGVDIQAVVEKFLPQPAPDDGALAGQPAAEAPPAAPEAPAETPAPEEEPPLRARQLLALAKREQALREREKRVEEIEGRAAQADRIAELFRSDPVAAAELLKLDEAAMSHAAAQWWNKVLGDDAPEDFKRRMADRARDERLAAIERRFAEPDRTKAEPAPTAAYEPARVEALDRELSAVVRSVPAGLDFLAVEARENPVEAYETLAQVTAALIQKDPNGAWPSALEVAKAVDAQLRADVARFTGVSATTPQSKTTPDTQRAAPAMPPTTLSDADTSPRPDRQPERLLSDEEYLERAMRRAHALGYR